MKFRLLPLCGIAVAAVATPAIAQDGSGEDSVFDGDYLSVGIGGAYGPSYDGSDDYVFSPIPIIQGSLGGIDINPRGAGLALDFIPGGDKVDIDMGIAGRLRLNRTRQIKDPVVEAAGKLDTAVEVGPTAGISFSGLLNPYDSLSFNTDALWDVAGAHDGMTINPSLTYFTPFSRGIAGSLSVSGEYGDSDFNDYYYSVNAAQATASGLPVYQAHSGFTKVNTSLFLGVDLDGNLENGGFALFAVGNYSRMLNDAKDSPYTSIRGSADQWFGAFGIGYTF